MKFEVEMILDQSVVSKWIWWMGMIIEFHFCRRKHIERNYGMNSKMKILKFSYLNLNICKVVQIFLDRGSTRLGTEKLSYCN
jgi:hypothetical protein